MSSADLYLSRIDFKRYIREPDCRLCGFPSCDEFVKALRAGVENVLHCRFIGENISHALDSVERIKELWPDVPLLTHPRPSFTGVLELNGPGRGSPVLVSGNNEYTEQVLMTVLGTTASPFFVVFADTDGNTVDMAMVYGTLTAERIDAAMKEARLQEKSDTRRLIIPGLADSLKREIEELTEWEVRVGPVCAAELPLFLSEIWMSPDTT